MSSTVEEPSSFATAASTGDLSTASSDAPSSQGAVGDSHVIVSSQTDLVEMKMAETGTTELGTFDDGVTTTATIATIGTIGKTSSRETTTATEGTMVMLNDLVEDGQSQLEVFGPPQATPQQSTGASSYAATITKLSGQLKRLTDANTKYKQLLKMAKDRIQKHEEEVDELRRANQSLEERVGILAEVKDGLASAAGTSQVLASSTTGASIEDTENSEPKIINVIQRIKVPAMMTLGSTSSSNHVSEGGGEEIWALIELEVDREIDSTNSPTRYREWKRFGTETMLQDYIRRDTGEPITLPPYSLSPEQSAKIQRDASQEISKITEEFRRFRVRAELARKQADSQIRELQIQRTNQRISGQPTSNNITNNANYTDQNKNQQQQQKQGENNNNDGSQAIIRKMERQIDQLKAELATNDIRWKDSYNVLLLENESLKSSGSDALLASQWRQRYEACLKEKDDLLKQFQKLNPGINMDEQLLLSNKNITNNNLHANENQNTNYELKYRDLKESFRLYRKKAKEFFDAQQHLQSDSEAGGPLTFSSALSSASSFANNLSSNSRSSSNANSVSADAKLAYLKNLMKNYLASDPTVRSHMEVAIVTVLQFSEDEMEQMAKKKNASSTWF